MNNKVLKGLMALVMAAVAVVLIIIMINHIRMGLATSNAKLMLALYAVMIAYSLYRVFFYVKEVLKK